MFDGDYPRESLVFRVGDSARRILRTTLRTTESFVFGFFAISHETATKFTFDFHVDIFDILWVDVLHGDARLR